MVQLTLLLLINWNLIIKLEHLLLERRSIEEAHLKRMVRHIAAYGWFAKFFLNPSFVLGWLH